MIDRLYHLVNEIFIVIGCVMAICFLAFPIPQNKELKNYRISLKILAGAYFLIALLTLAILLFNLNDNSKEVFSFISLMLSSSQALLFTFTMITLLNPHFVTQRFIFWQLLPIIIITALYAVISIIYGDPITSTFTRFAQSISHPTVFIRFLFFIFYVFQLFYYSKLYLIEEKNYKEGLDNYFSENIHLKLPWVRFAFLAALFCGNLSMISNFFPYKEFDITLTTIFMSFYLFFAIEYLNYPNIYKTIHPVINNIDKEDALVSQWSNYKKIILDKKYYLNLGITIDEMAKLIQLNRTTLSKFINSEENMNFNTWINTLRITEARKLMISKPDLSIRQIAEQTGFSEQTNFSRQFRIITGISPTEWKQNVSATRINELYIPSNPK